MRRRVLQFPAALDALEAKLVEVERDYGISQLELRKRLFLFPISIRGLLIQTPAHLSEVVLRGLPEVENRIKLYRAALASVDRDVSLPGRETGTERAALESLLADAEDLARSLGVLRRLFKLDPGRRTASPAQRAILGDIAAEVAGFLSGKIHGRWTRGKGIRGTLAPRPYKAKAIALAAELVTLAYRPFYGPTFQITPSQVKSRISVRLKRRKEKKVISPSEVEEILKQILDHSTVPYENPTKARPR